MTEEDGGLDEEITEESIVEHTGSVIDGEHGQVYISLPQNLLLFIVQFHVQILGSWYFIHIFIQGLGGEDA